MSTNPREKRSFKKKITAYTVLLAVFVIFFLIYLFFSKERTLISPLGKSNTDISRVEEALRRERILFSQVLILSDSSYSISIPNNGQVRLSSQKSIDEQIPSLQRILRELTIEGKPFKSIDFRFEEPIISF
jgi:hypothetical protein